MTGTESMLQRGMAAREASAVLAHATTAVKNQALLAIAEVMRGRQTQLLAANEQDLAAAQAAQLSTSLLERLRLTEASIAGMLEGLSQVAALEDPVGELSGMAYRPNGLQVGKMRVPLGVIGVIYESRPNVTIDAASLCLKSGNAVILRGGSEAIHSNLALADCITEGLSRAGLPEASIQVIKDPDRALVGQLIKMNEYVDVIIPRGGKALIERIAAESTLAVIKHLDGVCHVYVDADANRDMAHKIALNAKTQSYAVCNAMETLLVEQLIAAQLLPGLATELIERGVELRGCEQSLELLAGHCQITAAQEEDWYTEYLAPILSIRVVSGLEEAIAHINHYGSQHTDTIVTENYTRGRQFLRAVDSSSVMLNASPRLADGFEYGLGAEMGISTDKLHVRGPVGLEGLTTQKFVVFGDGQLRQ